MTNSFYSRIGLVVAGLLWSGMGLARADYSTQLLGLTPVVYYQLNGPVGSTVATNSGSRGTAANAAYNGGAQVVTGPRPSAFSGFATNNNAASFSSNGVAGWLACGTNASLTGSTDFSVSAWIKTTDTSVGTIIQQRDATANGYNGEYKLLMNADGTLEFFIYNGGFQFDIVSTATVNDGNWHQVVAGRQGTNGFIYLDTAQVASGSGTVVSLNGALLTYVGRDMRDSLEAFNGSIDEVAIYTSALNLVTAQSLYLAGVGASSNQPPFFFTQPQVAPATVYTGQTFTLTVGASGQSPLTYIWRNGGVPVSSSTNSSFATNCPAGAYSFDVIVTNSFGAVTSTPPLSVSVQDGAPVFAVNLPATVSVFAGGTMTLNPVVTSIAAVSYQWRSNGIPISSATNASLQATGILASAAGSVFNVVVSNAYGTNTSASAVLNVVTLTPPGFPGGVTPGAAQSFSNNGVFTLSNNLVAMSWALTNGQLLPLTFVNNLATQTWSQAGSEIFRLGHSTAAVSNARHLGIRLGTNTVDAVISMDGVTWTTLTSLARADFPGDPAFVQLGKMDLNGTNTDYASIGAMGECHLDNLLVQDTNGVTLLQENFNSLSPNWTVFQSTRPGTSVSASNGWLVVDANANCAAYARRPLPTGVGIASCLIDKNTDQGMSWSPSICLRWSNGTFLLVGYRTATTTFNVISTSSGEMVLTPGAVGGSFNLAASDCVLVGSPLLQASTPNPLSARFGDQLNGQELAATFVDTNSGLTVNWRAVLRDNASYLRQFFTFSGSTTNDQLTSVQLLDFATGNSTPTQIGTTTSGNPVVAGQTFFGGETPFASDTITSNRVNFSVPVTLPLGTNARYEFSSVVGVFPAGQQRRGFLYYLERERAMAYRPLMHYNTWLDIQYSQSDAVMSGIINTTETEMGKRLGSGMSSYCLDDGWDNSAYGFWAIDPNKFPNGFTNLTATVAARGTHMSAWISPLGGYPPQQSGRISAAQSAGLIASGSSTPDLSYAPFYNWWTNRCATFITDHQMDYFKWDNAGSGVTPHFMSLLRAGDYLRTVSPTVFLNVTVGTWSSPFWLSHVDSIWRNGADTGFQGDGNSSEQWLNYRDAKTYANVAQAGPLFPLNSIMVHGLIAATNTLSGARNIFLAQSDLRNQARSFFGSGANLQELYITPSALSSNQWNQICEAAAWARNHANVLVDTHWVGGDPGQTNVYGWASWTPTCAALTLRNPSASSNSITLDVQTIFELPANAPTNYTLVAAYADQRTTLTNLTAGQAVSLTLAPFEVLVFDATPVVLAQSPVITQPPVSQTNYAGHAITFTGVATGTAPLAYQWSFNSVAITGATNNSLVLPSVSASNAGNYSMTVTNVAGATNATATLTVLTTGGLLQMSALPAGGGLNVSWTGTGTLQWAPAVIGPWSNLPNQGNPQMLSPTNAAAFFRVRY